MPVSPAFSSIDRPTTNEYVGIPFFPVDPGEKGQSGDLPDFTFVSDEIVYWEDVAMQAAFRKDDAVQGVAVAIGNLIQDQVRLAEDLCEGPSKAAFWDAGMTSYLALSKLGHTLDFQRISAAPLDTYGSKFPFILDLSLDAPHAAAMHIAKPLFNTLVDKPPKPKREPTYYRGSGLLVQAVSPVRLSPAVRTTFKGMGETIRDETHVTITPRLQTSTWKRQQD